MIEYVLVLFLAGQDFGGEIKGVYLSEAACVDELSRMMEIDPGVPAYCEVTPGWDQALGD